MKLKKMQISNMSHTLRRSPRINRKRNRDSYDNDDETWKTNLYRPLKPVDITSLFSHMKKERWTDFQFFCHKKLMQCSKYLR